MEWVHFLRRRQGTFHSSFFVSWYVDALCGGHVESCFGVLPLRLLLLYMIPWHTHTDTRAPAPTQLGASFSIILPVILLPNTSVISLGVCCCCCCCCCGGCCFCCCCCCLFLLSVPFEIVAAADFSLLLLLLLLLRLVHSLWFYTFCIILTFLFFLLLLLLYYFSLRFLFCLRI